jgi:hypothetical protein
LPIEQSVVLADGRELPIGTQLGFNVPTGQINDWMVPGTGLEPARLAALDPKSSASANSAIPATWYK